MAISPSILENDLQKHLEKLEKMIDDHLLSRNSIEWSSGRKITIATSIFPGLRYQHLEPLRKRYIDAGWLDVKWHSDQRDGDYLEFIA
jgi:hypothetical protein